MPADEQELKRIVRYLIEQGITRRHVSLQVNPADEYKNGANTTEEDREGGSGNRDYL